MFKKVLGTKDLLPEEVRLWQDIENTGREIFALYNYREIRTPLIEEAALYSRSLGGSTEIVGKQMFLIERGEDKYALRPEGTASVVRAYLENGLDKSAGFAKLFYIGPMFRAERPQKGRLRQFHHIGCEALGSSDAVLDVEIISLAEKLLSGWGVSGHEILVNSLGCRQDKQKLADSLKNSLQDKRGELCPECQQRLDGNVLRILDCKNEECRRITSGMNGQNSHLCPDCAGHFKTVLSGLDAVGVKYTVSANLVRGLDYYTRTVFEINHPGLGAQSAIGAGGRYDNLIAELGGQEKGAAGFAFGMERVMLVSRAQARAAVNLRVFVVPLGAEARAESVKILGELRGSGISADTDYEGKSIKGAMRSANSLGAVLVMIIGEDELRGGTVLIKNMSNGTQEPVNRDKILQAVKERLDRNV
ncbi:MAG: histidine--tRNA ligase [Candidatus Omnitrophota bacterium]|jgi:histidyl-tRNA synthetase